MTIADWPAKMEIDQKQKQKGGRFGEIHRIIRSTLLEGIQIERIRPDLKRVAWMMRVWEGG
jgi:hypothetical protein